MRGPRATHALLAAAAAAGGLACGGAADPGGTGAGAPHGLERVLLISVDTLRPDYLSFYGYDRPTTPFVDSLLARGAVFDRALAPIARTTQSLASLMTGLYPHSHGVRVLWDALPEGRPTLPELAAEAGYATLAVVSNHLLTPERGLARGFDLYDVAPDTRDAAGTTRAALAHLAAREPGERLFVWVHYIDPHAPYYPPEPLARRFDEGYEGPYATRFGTSPGGIGDRAYPPELGKAGAVFRNRLPDAVNAHVRRLYAADIRQSDDAIAELVTRLRRRFGDWLVVFASDHGEALGEHDYYYDHGDYVTDPELRVPLALILPEAHPLAGPRRVADPVSLLDVTPTLVELLELSPARPLETEGVSLVPALRGEALAPRTLFAESGESFHPPLIRGRVSFDLAGRFRAAVEGDWKLVWTPGGAGAAEYALYDLASDPGETRDLYREDHPRARHLRERLAAWVRADADEPEPPDAADAARLRALGYLE